MKIAWASLAVVLALGAFALNSGRDGAAELFSGKRPATEARVAAPTAKIVSAQAVQSAQPAVQILDSDTLVAQAPSPAPSATPAPPTQPAASGSPAVVVDQSALRYFARNGDTKRLAAEVARLRALYPNWTPPADPLAVPAQPDVLLEAMWKLYTEGKYAEVRKAIADRKLAEPSWATPPDLVDRLGVAEARERLVNASNLKQYETVVRIAADTPSLLTCSEVDILWRVAESFALTDRAPRAKDAYLYILNNCDAGPERLATVQKAIALLPVADIKDLLSVERVGTDGVGEFAAARADLVRATVAAAGKDPSVEVLPADITSLEGLAEKDGLASDGVLLGWYYIGQKDPAKAEKWFSMARKDGDSAEVSQGLGLALIDLNRAAEAEDIVYPWRDESNDIRNVYLAAVTTMIAPDPPPDISPAVLARLVPVVVQARDVPSAQQLGWYARGLNQHQTAGKWFTTALVWKHDDEPSAYGLALTRMQLGDKAGVKEIQRLWDGRSDRIAELGETGGRKDRLNISAIPAPFAEPVPAAGPRAAIGTQPPSSDEMSAAVTPEPQPQTRRSGVPATSGDGGGGSSGSRRNCSRTDAYSSLKGDAALATGWCLMDLNRPIEAARAFESAIETGNAKTRSDAAWGQSICAAT